VFTARQYPQIVADILVAVTSGVVGEAVTVPPTYPDDHLFFLTSRPVRRISRVDGFTRGPEDRDVPWRFTEADWELVSSTGRPTELDALRFRPRRPQPAGGTVMRVSYWPRDVPPIPLTDLNVGSVTRTLLETLAREVADAEAQLQVVYDSAFVDTAEGRSLDRVVALLGIERRAADTPRGKVRFHRKAGAAGQVTIPAGTEMLSLDGARYGTTAEAVLQPGETSVDVPVAGERPSTPLVEARALDRPARALAGIDRVANDAATFRPTAPETDDELRTRARRAFRGAGIGTLDALVNGVGGLQGVVSSVQAREFPDDKPGVVDLDVALVTPDNPDHIALVEDTVRRLRPAGVVVRWGQAAAVDVAVDITRLVLTGSSRPVGEIEAVGRGLTERFVAALRALPPGGRLPAARAATLALADPNISDLDLRFTVAGTAGLSEVALPPSTTARPVTPVVLPVASFADAGAAGPPIGLGVRVIGRVQLVGATTLAHAQTAIRSRLEAWLAGPSARTALAFDAFAAAVRDDTAYGLVLEDTALVLERDGRFEQLVLGSPPRPLAAGETAAVAGVELEEAR
jgi:hypothetical protein